MQLEQSLQEKCMEFLEYLELRENEYERYWAVSDSASDEFRKMIQEMNEHRMNDNWTMQFIHDSLSAIAESGGREKDIFIEPDIYANQLTSWLGSRDDRIHFLTRAIRDFGISDGFLALQKAQFIEKSGILEKVQAFLRRLISVS